MDPSAMRKFQEQFQEEVKALQAFEAKIQSLRVPSAKLMTQVTENEMVLKEINLLDDDADVYKLMGPVMVKQELFDTKSNVENRLKYLNAELARIEEELRVAQEGAETQQKKLTELTEQVRKIQREAVEKAQKAQQGNKAK